MIHTEPNSKYFENLYDRLKPYHKLLIQKKSLIAFSGGKDSLLLLKFYNYLHNEKKVPAPILFHMDHSIRKNSEQESEIQKFLAGLPYQFYCIKKNIPLLSKRLGRSLEDTGRLFRYRELNKIAKRENSYLTTGHHTDDYLESLLIHLCRGGGYGSLGTLPVYSGNVFRPLLKLTANERADLISGFTEEIFPDESNEDKKYLRNRIRIDIIPLLKEIGMSADKLFDNFHDDDTGDFSEPKDPPPFLKIDPEILNHLSEKNLKDLLDIYLRTLKAYPITRDILREIHKELKKKSGFTIENREILFWKSPSSPLFLIPKSSPVLTPPHIEKKPDRTILAWNNRSLSILPVLYPGFYEEGLKIKVGSIHRLVSEILREFKIPAPVRNYIPILFNESGACQVLLSLFDGELKNYPSTLKD